MKKHLISLLKCIFALLGFALVISPYLVCYFYFGFDLPLTFTVGSVLFWLIAMILNSLFCNDSSNVRCSCHNNAAACGGAYDLTNSN